MQYIFGSPREFRCTQRLLSLEEVLLLNHRLPIIYTSSHTATVKHNDYCSIQQCIAN